MAKPTDMTVIDSWARRAGWLAAALALFTGNLFLHLPITDLSDAISARLGFSVYDRLLAGVFLLLGVAAVIVLLQLRRGARPLFWLGLVILLGLSVAANRLLLVASIENIHYPQYALLALALALAHAGLPIEVSWLASTALGAVDEGYQYLFLSRGRPSYLDWNDIVLNAIGAAYGVLLLLPQRRRPLRPLVFSSRTVAITVAVALAVGLLAAPPFSGQFFQTTPIGRRFHVLAASEGLAVIAALWMGVRGLLRRDQG